MRIRPDNEKLQYCGRIDWSNTQAPIFVYPCTSVKMRFTGSILKIHIRNKNAYWDNFLGYVLDGNQNALKLPEDGDAVLNIPITATNQKEHEVLFFKRQDSCHELTILGMEIADGEQLLEPSDRLKRRMEVYGDSVSAGEVSEALDYVGKEDPQHNGEYSNSWYSYAWMTARKLNAQIHDIAQGGIALMDKTGWFYEPDAIGMETVWDTIHYNPVFGKMVKWNLSEYVPQVVIVAIGQNDMHPQDYMKEDYECSKAVVWREHYSRFLDTLRKQYPDAQIICCTTLLQHDKNWDRSIQQVVDEKNDSKITRYEFKRNGKGTLGHLRIPEAQEMADELAAYIETLDIVGWNE